MYQLGDRIVYGMHGVCNVIDLQIRTVDRKKVEYFVLSPVDQPETHYFVPTQNPSALAKLRPMLSREQIISLLQAECAEAPSWIIDENRRKLRYRELNSSSDVKDLVAMVRNLHLHRARQFEMGKKFHMCDEKFLRDCEKALSAEFAIVLNVPVDEIKNTVEQIIHT
jgi:CarD family transcriptional regulator